MRLEEIDGVDEVTISEPQPRRRRHEAPARDRASSRARRSRRSSTAPRASPRSAAATSRRCRPCAAAPSSTSSTSRAPAPARSFELAAKRLSADLVSVKAAGSSVDKGESLKDTVATLSAYDPAAIVIRHPARRRRPAGRRLDRGRGRQRRRRQARAPEPGAARRLHAAPPPRLARGQADLDRRRRPAQPRRPLQPDRLPARWAPR